MDTFELNDYYVALIIISIITIAISLALSFYFIFLPARRIETQFNTLETKGLNTIQDLTSLANNLGALNDELLEDTCNSIIYAADRLFGCPQSTTEPKKGCLGAVFCLQDNPFIPTICQPYANIDPTCNCTVF